MPSHRYPSGVWAIAKIAPTENPSRAVHAVCPYWLTPSDGSRARAAGDQSNAASVLIVMSAKARFITIRDASEVPGAPNVALAPPPVSHCSSSPVAGMRCERDKVKRPQAMIANPLQCGPSGEPAPILLHEPLPTICRARRSNANAARIRAIRRAA